MLQAINHRRSRVTFAFYLQREPTRFVKMDMQLGRYMRQPELRKQGHACDFAESDPVAQANPLTQHVKSGMKSVGL